MAIAANAMKLMLGCAAMVCGVSTANAALRQASSVSVMTYNVHGLPWPLVSGREAAFAKIEARLSGLRKTGAQPHVIVLQEAFSDEAKQIGPRSGYRYSVTGPTRDLTNDVRATPADVKFANAASFFKGESSGKLLDSGLLISSDYPIVSVRRAAFPAFACAGYDCLANKGILLVTLAVPGDMPGRVTPITVATTHMNSRHASGVGVARSLYAYQRQVAAIDAFIAANRDPNLPIIFAGDFNASSTDRRSYLVSQGAHIWSHLPVYSALHDCVSSAEQRGEQASHLASSMIKRGRDWQFYSRGAQATLDAVKLFVPFGTESDGTMLSDHIGYAVFYRIGQNLAPLNGVF